MEVRVYLRRNLTKLAGAVASGNMNLTLHKRSHEMFSETMVCHWQKHSAVEFLLGNVCVEVCTSMFIIM